MEKEEQVVVKPGQDVDPILFTLELEQLIRQTSKAYLEEIRKMEQNQINW